MNPTNGTLDLMKQALGTRSDDLSKSITTGTGLVAYDLQAPAKNLYPVYTPLRNSIPRVGGGVGTATNWRQVSAIIGSGYDNSGWVPEGQRAGAMSYTTATIAASYVTFGEEDSVTFQAVAAGKTFEDLKATMVMRLLQKVMLKEENAIIGGNKSIALGIPTAPTLTATTVAGATLPALTYSVIVVALTQEGFYNSSLTNGVGIAKTVTGQDGATFVINGGASNQSAATTQAITLGQTLTCTTPAIRGAVAWAWFTGASGSETLQAITTVNTVVFSAPLTSGRQAATAVIADCSKNATLAFDGLLTTALNPANTAYVQTMSGTAGLTSSGRGSVVEIDNAFQYMWDNFQLGATVMYVNSQEQKNITTKVMTNASGTLVRYNAPAQDMKEPVAIVAGGVVSSYYNPFTPSGGQIIPIKVHPKVPPGTILMYCEELPIQYQNNEVSNVAEMKMRTDYFSIDWPLTSLKHCSGCYADGVLAVYCTFAMAVITNIANA